MLKNFRNTLGMAAVAGAMAVAFMEKETEEPEEPKEPEEMSRFYAQPYHIASHIDHRTTNM